MQRATLRLGAAQASTGWALAVHKAFIWLAEGPTGAQLGEHCLGPASLLLSAPSTICSTPQDPQAP